ncbi:hypothetical protein GCM10011610_66170 [Nocardia rhizosphaerihabitans]|uniref:Uncharacterized protein n=1 Tax=Nocardia rhizosphaerihabitans TaxID=1691570 RepID=A0ABQ2L2G7_9NOCA|nr:hypothetical protein GCM10011610_66170 [Nocardia rhizosphaerihabitans]
MVQGERDPGIEAGPGPAAGDGLRAQRRQVGHPSEVRALTQPAALLALSAATLTTTALHHYL